MNTTLSSFHRFHVVSFVLAAVCFAAMALLCQSAVLGQTNAIPYDNGVSFQNDAGESGFSNEGSSGVSNQETKKKSGKWRLWFWGIVMLAIFYVGGKPLLIFLDVLSGGRLRSQNPDAYDNLMQMPTAPVQIAIPQPQAPPQSPTLEKPADPNPVEDMTNVPQDKEKDKENNEKENK